jgi:hypothetical protein
VAGARRINCFGVCCTSGWQDGAVDGQIWQDLRQLPRATAVYLRANRKAIPREPGVYIWWRNDDPVYAGVAANTGGLRPRLSAHLATKLDLSHSSLRRNAAEMLLGVPTSVTKARPPVVREEQVRIVNEWIGGLTVAWLVLATADEAASYERGMHSEWMPPLSKR